MDDDDDDDDDDEESTERPSPSPILTEPPTTTPTSTPATTVTEAEVGSPSPIGTPSVTSVSANETVVTEGQPFEVVARIENPTGNRESLTLRLSLFGEVVESKAVSIPARGHRIVRFVQRIEAPGEYTASVNGESTTIVVLDDGEPEHRQTMEATVDRSPLASFAFLGSPVLGVLVPVVLILVVGLRRLQ